jgi:hypothetical protein
MPDLNVHYYVSVSTAFTIKGLPVTAYSYCVYYYSVSIFCIKNRDLFSNHKVVLLTYVLNMLIPVPEPGM